jgi:hypothetical protein
MTTNINLNYWLKKVISKNYVVSSRIVWHCPLLFKPTTKPISKKEKKNRWSVSWMLALLYLTYVIANSKKKNVASFMDPLAFSI